MDDSKSQKLFIKFENVDAGEASQLAMELMERLQYTSDKVLVEPHREDPNALNLGGELVFGLVDDSPIVLIANIIVTFFKEKGARVPLVFEDRLEKVAFSVEMASRKVEQELQEFLQHWFEKPSQPPKPEGGENEENKSVKFQGFEGPSSPPNPSGSSGGEENTSIN
jgi:hypothetical protein